MNNSKNKQVKKLKKEQSFRHAYTTISATYHLSERLSLSLASRHPIDKTLATTS